MRFIVFLGMLIFTISGFAQNKWKEDNSLTYQIFDSLENYFCNDIASKSAVDTPVCFVIDPVHLRFPNEGLPNQGRFIYAMCVCYKSQYNYFKEVNEKSNRFMSICGKHYPIYFFMLDEVFEDFSMYDKNYKFSNNVYIREDFYIRKWVFVDMAKKVYYLNFDFEHPYGARHR